MSKQKEGMNSWRLEVNSEAEEGSEGADKSRPPNDASEQQPAASQPTTDFPFINISNPSQSFNPSTQTFVRKAVQRKRTKREEPSSHGGRFQEPESPGGLAFVNISDPSQNADPGLRRAIRQSVQLRQRQEWARTEAIKHFEHSGPNYDSSANAGALVRRASTPSPIDSGLGTSSSTYPIEMDSEAHRLTEYLHTSLGPGTAAFKPIWFEKNLRDPASFLQQLSTVSMHLSLVQGNDPSQAFVYQQMAIRSVNDRLSHPVQSLSSGIVAAVLSFLVYDIVILDVERYKVDKEGLIRIIELRGGIATLEDDKVLMLMILWDDVCGFCTFDVPPTYGLPTRHLGPFPEESLVLPSESLLNVIMKWNERFPQRRELMRVMHDLSVLNALIATRIPAIWGDPFFLGMQINPIIIRLRPSLERRNEPGETIEIACRLAALIYLGDIRVEFVMYHVTGYHFVDQLKQIVFKDAVEWDEFQNFKLWVLIIGAIKASAADRWFFIEGIKKALERLYITSWEEATLVVASILWNDEIYGQRCLELGREVMGS